jgi:valyl-tRNA synthetase
LAPAGGWEDALIVARWPEQEMAEDWELEAIEDFGLIQEMVRAIRNIRSEYKVEPQRKISCTIGAGGKTAMLSAQRQIFVSLAGIDPQGLEILETLEPADDRVNLVVAPVEISLPLEGLIDLEAERARLEKELGETQAQIQRLENLLASPFAQKAPAEVVAKEREKLATYQETADRLQQQLSGSW